MCYPLSRAFANDDLVTAATRIGIHYSRVGMIDFRRDAPSYRHWRP